MKLTHSLLAVVAGSALAVAPAFATSVSGEVNLAGTATVNSVGIFFNNPFVVTVPNTGSFAGLSSGSIKDLIGAPQTGSITITDFMTFTGSSGTILFDLLWISPGVGSTAGCLSNTVGSLCTPPNSPFTLIQFTASSVLITLELAGIAYTGTSTSGSSASFVVFSTQVIGTITGILNAQSAGGFPFNYSASLLASETPQQATQTIINGVDTLYSQGVLHGGQNNSLVKELQQTINLMNAGKNAGAIENLDSFMSEMNDLLSSGVLTPSQANPLITAAQRVVARLS